MIVPFSFWKSGYIIQNAQAQTYWNALITAGFTEVTCMATYGINFNTIKKAIDVAFIGLNTDGNLSKLIAWHPCIGNSDNCHKINAANPGTFDLVYGGTNPVSHSKKGIVYDGTNYSDFLVPSGNLPQNDWTVGGVFADEYLPGTTIHGFGAQVSGSSKTFKFRVNIGTGDVQPFPGSDTTISQVANGGTNKAMWMITRTTSTAHRLSRDANATFQIGTLASVAHTSNIIIFGGLNNNGSKAGAFVGAIRHMVAANTAISAHIGFHNRITTLDASLNRTL